MLIWMVLFLVALVGVAALAIDVGSWYRQADRIQQAADAAALAGVVRMPDLTAATTEARRVAALNGFPHGGDITVEVTRGVSDRQLRVAITHARVPTLFGQMFLDSVTVSRTAAGEYLSRIPMGSPQNYLGWGGTARTPSSMLGPISSRPGYWLAINGACTPKEHGDYYLARLDGNSMPEPHCGRLANPLGSAAEDQSSVILDPAHPALSPGPSFRADNAYVFTVTVSSLTPSADVHIEAFDPSFCAYGPSPIDGSLTSLAGADVPFLYAVRFPDTAGTPLEIRDDAFLPGKSLTDIGTTSCSPMDGSDQWYRLATITPGMPRGAYSLEVTTRLVDNSLGANAFALRAVVATSGSAWGTTFCDATRQPGCPQVSGASALSVFTQESGGVAEFSFAEIPAAYAGRTLLISLWDPGEGMDSVEILPPGSSIGAEMSAIVVPNPNGGPPALQTVGRSFSVAGTATDRRPNRASNWRFNDRLVQLVVRVPTSYSGGWWRVRYRSSTGQVADRTTWMIELLGDPVRLVRAS